MAFPRGFPTRLSPGLYHVPPWWESILGVNVEAVEQNRFLWNGLRHLRDSCNGDTALELLSLLLWRAPPLHMRRERPGFSPEQSAKGSLISTYEAETELFWMWAGPSCFLSSGDGYVGELVELQQGCENSNLMLC